MRSKTLSPILFLIFLVSGFCGLLYQLVWVRLAYAAFGIITPILSVVISVFMLGLAIGSWAGGRFADRMPGLKSFSALVPYALMEMLIGVGGLSVPGLFQAGRRLLLPVGSFNSSQYLILSGVVLAVSILPWCVCMGATIPLMMKFIRQVNRGQTKSFSFLYMANVIGAMFGTLATAFFLIEQLGLRRTLLVGAGLNFFIAFFSLVLNFVSFQEEPQKEKAPLAATSALADRPRGIRPGLALSLLFMTGFTSMAMEVAWTRAFTPVLLTSIYAFAGVLAVYLLATWSGSALYRRHLRFHTVRGVPRLVAILALVSLIPIAVSDPRLMRIPYILVIEAMLLSVFPFCAALGYLTSQLIDDLSQGRPGVAGKAYAVNAVGCILGPLCAGYIFLPQVGTKLTLVLLAAPYALYFLIFSVRLLRRRPVWTPVTAVVILALLAVSFKFFWSYEDKPIYRSGVIRRDYAASVISYGQGLDKKLLVNGVGMTALSTVTKSMAHIPLAIREAKPESALVICFGMGTTFRSATSWGIKVTAVELVPSVVAAFGYYFDDARQLMRKPGRRIVVDDGRRYLQRTLDTYDLIAIDPSPPVESSGSSLLYSEDFYETAKARLKPAGILAQWLPAWDPLTLRAAVQAIRNRFPYVRLFRSLDGSGAHLFASRRPFELPAADVFASRLPPKAAQDFTEWTPQRTPAFLFQKVKDGEVPLSEILTPGPALSLTDDRPINEYFLLRRLFGGQEVRLSLGD